MLTGSLDCPAIIATTALESTPPEARGPALLGQAGKLVDAPEAARLAAVMREALAGSVPAGA